MWGEERPCFDLLIICRAWKWYELCPFPRVKSFSASCKKNTVTFLSSLRLARMTPSCIKLTEPFWLHCALLLKQKGGHCWQRFRMEVMWLIKYFGMRSWTSIVKGFIYSGFPPAMMCVEEFFGGLFRQHMPFPLPYPGMYPIFSSKCMWFRKAPQLVLILFLSYPTYWYPRVMPNTLLKGTKNACDKYTHLVYWEQERPEKESSAGSFSECIFPALPCPLAFLNVVSWTSPHLRGGRELFAWGTQYPKSWVNKATSMGLECSVLLLALCWSPVTQCCLSLLGQEPWANESSDLKENGNYFQEIANLKVFSSPFLDMSLVNSKVGLKTPTISNVSKYVCIGYVYVLVTMCFLYNVSLFSAICPSCFLLWFLASPWKILTFSCQLGSNILCPYSY